MKRNRIMFAGTKSGTGKTTITCGILRCLKERGMVISSFKCGPDYIDPMFHRKVIGTKSYNLDIFLSGEEAVKEVFLEGSKDSDISVMEGVMGYYDGIGFTEQSSSYEVASLTATPVILIIEAKGMGNSLGALLQGFLKYKKDSRIAGVIFNRLSPVLYEAAQNKCVELGTKCFGYVPELKDIVIESRHLGLLMAEEIQNLGDILSRLSNELEKTVDIEGLLELASEATAVEYSTYIERSGNHDPAKPSKTNTESDLSGYSEGNSSLYRNIYQTSVTRPVKIGVAMDEAFTFYYRENLKLLESLGGEIIPFSPLRDDRLPKELSGLYLGGGYPELHGEGLSKNISIREEIRECIHKGIPVIAECGGFLYLQKELEDKEGKVYEMVGTFSGKAFPTGRLRRFGYVELKAEKDSLLAEKGECLRAHEFHYWDSDIIGEDYLVTKASNGQEWREVIATDRMYAGFPHLYFPGNVKAAWRYLKKAEEYGR
ncbi:cobyrinate a,c-diamide synthase [Anaerocolumna sp. AGMB13020]|uniref:cobyrinate a,c-diamide synthase n=1 Tax=Anaerocolumna sp. AGMB13020 TaxID=3081750 RepID=UPI0029534FBA|nr:cobyrinate a,c-diamide synthase [Anaerocolumna sp. AGMB13020]WOO38619.1 cobyrinate a,c-diamide synthase [Anaerocolumna sp. AGMB13020]